MGETNEVPRWFQNVSLFTSIFLQISIVTLPQIINRHLLDVWFPSQLTHLAGVTGCKL